MPCVKKRVAKFTLNMHCKATLSSGRLLAALSPVQSHAGSVSSRNAPPNPLAPICIVGAGPCGMVSALLLHQAGYRNITVLERQENASFRNPLREFTFLVNGKGYQALENAGIVEEVEANGVASNSVKGTTLHRNKPPVLGGFGVPGRRGTWIMRSKLNRLLYEHVSKTDGIQMVLGA